MRISMDAVRWWPAVAWLGSALGSLALYFHATAAPPVRTPIGVERRLFGPGELDALVTELPDGRRWLLHPFPAGDPPRVVLVRARRPPPFRLPSREEVVQGIREFRWPPGDELAESPGGFRPFLPEGAWLLEGRTLRRVRDLEADEGVTVDEIEAGAPGTSDGPPPFLSSSNAGIPPDLVEEAGRRFGLQPAGMALLGVGKFTFLVGHVRYGPANSPPHPAPRHWSRRDRPCCSPWPAGNPHG